MVFTTDVYRCKIPGSRMFFAARDTHHIRPAVCNMRKHFISQVEWDNLPVNTFKITLRMRVRTRYTQDFERSVEEADPSNKYPTTLDAMSNNAGPITMSFL